MLTTFMDQPLPGAIFDSEDLRPPMEIIVWIHFFGLQLIISIPNSFSFFSSLMVDSLHALVSFITLDGKQPIHPHILDFDRKMMDLNISVSWRIVPEDNSSRPR